MGLFKKLIDILSDDVEEEIEEVKEPVKKEEQIERVAIKETPKPQETKFVNTGIYDASKDKDLLEKTTTVPERGLYQSKDTFKFPVFDDKDIEKTLSRSRNTNVMEREIPKERVMMPESTPRREETRVNAIPTMTQTQPTEKKTFRPSPVISPIYGVLDKNYKKEEIIERKDEIAKSIPKTELSYDTVRRKAYGTLEDDLEDALMSINKNTLREVEEIEKELDSLENPKKHIEKLLDELEKTATMTVGELEEALKNEVEDTIEIKDSIKMVSEFDEEQLPAVEPKKMVEDEFEFTEEFKPRTRKTEKVDEEKLENDLFNLIDSMYEEGDE